MINLPPRGLIVDLVTPLDRAGGLDRTALICLIRRLEGEVNGFAAGSLRMGEGLGLGLDVRLEVLKVLVDTSREGAAVFFEITGTSREETIKLLERAEDLLGPARPQAEIFYLLTPLIYHGNRGLPDHLAELGRHSRRPFILGNNPDLIGLFRAKLQHKNIRTSVIKKTAANEQVVGLQFEGDLDRALHYQQALKSRQNFRFYDGSEDNFMERPSSSGLVSCGANLAPKAWADIVKSSLNIYDSQRLSPDHLSHIWESGRMVRLLSDIYRPNPPAFIKAALKLMGLIPSATAASKRTTLNDDQVRRIESGLKELGLL